MADDDKRRFPTKPIARIEFAQASWATGAGHTAQTDSKIVNGTIKRVDVLISSVTDNPTVNVTITDQNSVEVISLSTLADGTKHMKLAESHKATQDADFNPVPVNGTLTVSIDPSADPGGTSQTLTVDVILYME